MIMVKKLLFPDDEVGSGEEEPEETPCKWVAHNEREQQIRSYQETVKTAATEKTAWATEDATRKAFLMAHQNILGSTTLGLKEESEEESNSNGQD